MPSIHTTPVILNYCFLPYLQNTTGNKWDLLVFPKFERDRRIPSFSQTVLRTVTPSGDQWRDTGGMEGGCVVIWQIWCDHL